jgi:hypothetical protein
MPFLVGIWGQRQSLTRPGTLGIVERLRFFDKSPPFSL